MTHVVVERNRAVAVETATGDVVRARRAVLADTGPRALFGELVGTELLPDRFLAGLRRFRYGTGVFKLDIALDGPAPWSRARAGRVRRGAPHRRLSTPWRAPHIRPATATSPSSPC